MISQASPRFTRKSVTPEQLCYYHGPLSAVDEKYRGRMATLLDRQHRALEERWAHVARGEHSPRIVKVAGGAARGEASLSPRRMTR